GLYKAKYALIFSLPLASLGVRLLAYLILSKYIHLLESGTSITLPLIEKSVSSKSYELLASASLACLCLFVGSAIAKYVADRLTLNLMAAYELFCVQRAVDGISRYGGHKRLAKWQIHFSRLMNADSR